MTTTSDWSSPSNGGCGRRAGRSSQSEVTACGCPHGHTRNLPGNAAFRACRRRVAENVPRPPARTTVVIATRNRADELSVTLRHLGALDPLPPVIVVDNNSDDHTVEVSAPGRAAVPLDHRLVLNRNEGAVARNYGSYAANTPFVAFCDDDSWWAPGALARAEALFDAFPRLGLIAARTLVGVEQRDDPVNHELLHSPLGHDDSAPGPSVLGFLACSSIVRRSAFLEAGGFSSVLEFAGEESLLAYDLAAAGWMLCYAEDVVSHHHPSERRMPTVKRRNRQRRNELLTMWMRRPLGRCFTANLRLGLSVMREPAVAGAAVGTAVALPRALRQRRRLPDAVERQVRILERSGASA